MAIYIYLRNKDLEKIRIWKMGKNSSLWTNLDPLTTNIFWIYNLSSLDLIKYLAFHKSQHQTLLEAKNYVIFSKTLMLRTFDLTNCFYFFTVISTFGTAYMSFFMINVSAVALLYLIKVLIVLIPWVRMWHIHLYY